MNIEEQRQIFKNFGSLYIKDVIPKDLYYFLTHYMLREEAELNLNKIKNDHNNQYATKDPQVPTATSFGHFSIFDTVNEIVWPYLEVVVGEELIPTYSYARLYRTGDKLDPHTDRPSCEISITIQLGRSHHYSWPIWAGKQRYDLAEGDGMLYKGCEVQHYRKMCDGPAGYYSGQVFLHYVRANGPYSDWAGDRRWSGEINFKRLRAWEIESK